MRKKILLFTALLFIGLSVYSDNNSCNMLDEGVRINGRWATRNVGAPGTFVETLESSGVLFTWNNRNVCPQGWRVGA